MKFSVVTLGCRLNSHESEAIISAFADGGWEISPSSKGADLVVVNSCTVTSKADQKGRRIIRALARGGSVVIVTGCYATLDEREVELLYPGMVVAIPNEKKPLLMGLPAALGTQGAITIEKVKSALAALSSESPPSPFGLTPKNFIQHSRASIKVQDGCNNSCAFCRVHLARGKSVSAECGEVLKEAECLVNKGVKEITLVGVNLASYSYKGTNLCGLVRLLAPVLQDAGALLRFSSLEIDQLPPDFVEVASLECVAPFFHFPIQSGSNKVLSATGRHYTTEDASILLSAIRGRVDNPAFGCDIITGLPGETEDDFLDTLSFLASEHFALVHAFPFSPRGGTPFAASRDRVPERVRDERAERVRLLAEDLRREYTQSCVGMTLRAVVETDGGKGGLAQGEYSFTTENYLKGTVKSSYPLHPGELIRVSLSSEGIFNKI